MGQCFVIQPFDEGGKYDKRYFDIIKPAIKECGFEPYRVDQDPNSQIPISDIDYQIRISELCLAEITENNPNVWFEIGLAIAYKKEIVLICSKERTGKYPFDIQHRTVISYENESPSDFEKLKDSIKAKIKALKDTLVNSPIDSEISNSLTDGLEEHEIEILNSIASYIESPDNGEPYYGICKDLEKFGYSKTLILIGLRKLTILNYIIFSHESDYNGNTYVEYKMTEKGLNWLLDNRHLFKNEEINNKPVISDIDF